MFEALDAALATARLEYAKAIATAQTNLGFVAQVVMEGDSVLVETVDPNSLLVHEGFTRITGEVVQPNRYTETAIAQVDVVAILGAVLEDF
jgi:hypothetical protein